MTERHTTLLRALRSSDNSTRVAAAEELGRLDAPDAVGPLVAALGTCIIGDYDHEQCVAQAALIALGLGRHRALVNASLASFLRRKPHTSHAKQVLAAQVLAKVGDVSSATTMADLLIAHAARMSSDTQSAWVATEIAAAMGDNAALASLAAYPTLLIMRERARYDHEVRATRRALETFASPPGLVNRAFAAIGRKAWQEARELLEAALAQPLDGPAPPPEALMNYLGVLNELGHASLALSVYRERSERSEAIYANAIKSAIQLGAEGYDVGLQILDEALQRFPTRAHSKLSWNGACVCALAGRPEQARALRDEALRLAGNERNEILNDPELASITP